MTFCQTRVGYVYISRSIFCPIGFNKLSVSQVIDKKTKQLILVMLPKWVALLGMIVLMIKLIQLKQVIISML
jgi:hypothetical protein